MSEHFPPDIGQRRALWQLRTQFFEALEELCPQARQGLENRVWRPFSAAYQQIRRKWLAAESDEARGSEPDRPSADWYEPLEPGFADWYYDALEEEDPSALRLQQEVEKWAKEFDLQCDWVIEAAIMTMEAWASGRAQTDQSEWSYPGSGIWTYLSDEEKVFTFSFRWDPLHERPRNAGARIKREFSRRLTKWIGATERLAESRGFEPAPATEEETKHLRWLVRFHVLKESPDEIADQTPGDVSQQAVLKAVNKMSDLIDLPRRGGKRGPRRPSS